jgi:hypothetical protein
MKIEEDNLSKQLRICRLIINDELLIMNGWR